MREAQAPSRPRGAALTGGVLLAFLSAACQAVGPDYVEPEVAMPDAWQREATAGMSSGEASIHSWWELLNDPVLDDLIASAAAGNKDLEQAFWRIREARALRGIATGERYPDLDGSGFARRRRESEVVGIPGGQTDEQYSLGVDASWEIDLWGRISRSIESADAGLQASVEDYRDTLVLLFSEVAFTYVEARALQARIRVTADNIETQRGTLKLTQDRYDAQISPELDVRQAELNLARTESFLPPLRQGLAASIHRIGVLLGEHPGALYEQFDEARPIPELPEDVGLGLPADLIRQRPDIRRAERELAAQTARVGIATADLYPRFSLTGNYAYVASRELFDSGNREWSLGPSMSWNLFDGGRVRNAILFEDARTEEALQFYEQTVLLALEEVENSIVAYAEEHVRHLALSRSVAAARRSVELVKTLYLNGLTDFQNVLDMERSLAEEEDQLFQSAGRVVQNLISLYRSLGGGWQPDPEELADELDSQEHEGEPIF